MADADPHNRDTEENLCHGGQWSPQSLLSEREAAPKDMALPLVGLGRGGQALLQRQVLCD